MPTLNVINPEAITYQTEELGFTILGGIRLDGLDRLRVTLKIEVVNRLYGQYLNNPEIAGLALRHNLDLYNDVQVEKLIRKASERLEVGILQLSKAIADITAQLERYRLEQTQQLARGKADKVKPLSPEETASALAFLQAPDLMERTGALIGESGVIGEIHNRLLMYLIFTSRKTASPLHVISFGSSGAGKSHLQEKVAELIPTEDKIESTSLTSNALYYFGEYDLEHKLILIEDLDGAEPVLYALRELISKKHITKLVPLKDAKGVTRTLSFTVKGPVTVAGCTTRESVYEDNANRSFLVYIDESKEQDEAVMAYQRQRSAGLIRTEEQQRVKTLLQNTQRLLQSITVRNPYAEQLKLPPEVFKPRRTNAHYLAFIEAVTFYHQHQREQRADQETGELYIETTIADIEAANVLMKSVLLRKADDLSGAARNYLEQLKAHLQQKGASQFHNREIRHALRLPGTTLRRYHTELLQGGYIKLIEDKKQKGYCYEIVSYEEYAHLERSIHNVLDNITHALRTSEPVVSHAENGSLKPKPTKRVQGSNHPNH
jgi:hypothetical protein